jgi:hypothetical protein
MGRSILAVVLGYVVVGVIVMAADWLSVSLMLPGPDAQPTPAYLAVNLLCGAVAAALGGYVAALIGRRAPFRHGVALAVVLFVLAVASAVAFQFVKLPENAPPPWYPWALVALAPPCALAGGWLRAARRAGA